MRTLVQKQLCPPSVHVQSRDEQKRQSGLSQQICSGDLAEAHAVANVSDQRLSRSLPLLLLRFQECSYSFPSHVSCLHSEGCPCGCGKRILPPSEAGIRHNHRPHLHPDPDPNYVSMMPPQDSIDSCGCYSAPRAGSHRPPHPARACLDPEARMNPRPSGASLRPNV